MGQTTLLHDPDSNNAVWLQLLYYQITTAQQNTVVFKAHKTYENVNILIECVPEKSAVLGIIDQGCSPVVDCAWLPHVPQPFTLAIHRDTNNSAVKTIYDTRQLKQV